MTARSFRYIQIKKIIKVADRLNGCVQFPHFGAHYPDACCIGGLLWDLDSGDSELGLTIGGSDPCPTCNTRIYIQDMLDNEIPIQKTIAHLKLLFSKY